MPEHHLPSSVAARLCAFAPASFPRTIDKIDRLIGNGLAPTPVIISVITSDPLITAAVLGQANVTGSEVPQLSQAVLQLGLSMVQGLARSLVPIPNERMVLMNGYWAESIACATMMRVLIAYRPTMFVGSVDEETAHSCGLLHNLGAIVAALQFPAAYDQAAYRLAAGEGPMPVVLGSELGCDLAVLVERLAVLWGLPPIITTTAVHHRHPRKAPQFLHLCCAVHVARLLARGCGYCPEHESFVEPVDEGALELLDLTLSDFPRILDRFFDEMEQLETYEPQVTPGP